METDFHLITLLCFSVCSLSNYEQQERQGTEAASGQPLWRDTFKCFCCSFRCCHVKLEQFQRTRRNLFQPAEAFYLPRKYKVGDMRLFFERPPGACVLCDVSGTVCLWQVQPPPTKSDNSTIILRAQLEALSSYNENITLLPSCHFCFSTLSLSERIYNSNRLASDDLYIHVFLPCLHFSHLKT